MPNGNYMFRPRSRLEKNLKVIVVDEVSMLPRTLWDLLCSHKVYIIALGDPGQLPPIDKDENNHVLDNPHIFLDEIMRQAQESEIIRLSMHVREGKSLSSFHCNNEQVMIIKPIDVTEGMLKWADQILCATNATRHTLNANMRNILGFPADHIVPGDKIINLHNEWELKSNKDNPLTNGIISEVKEYNIWNNSYPYQLRHKSFYIPIFDAIITGEEKEEEYHVLGDYNELLTGTPSLTGPEEFQLLKRFKSLSPIIPLHFNYGYAITCWKAQGSQWEKILGYEEQFPRIPIEHTQYLYTLITRAQDRLVLVQK